MEVSLDAVLALRKVWQNQHSIKVSVNDFIIRACALALRDVPHVNRTYNAATDTVSPQSSIDVSVAVATPTGLITPIVFSTDALGLSEISRRVADLAGRARDGKLQPHEYQGGTFSISNLGMYGISSFSAVINPPQAAILAVGGGTPTLVPAGKSILYDETLDTDAKSAPPTVQSIMTAQLSADRRVVDEATASLFLQTLRHYLQTPQLLML
jgi:pyruvate dehydrogenase E2 component (dihydrolipoamide acetyltransferase)